MTTLGQTPHLTACLDPLHHGPCAGSHHKGFLGKVKRDESTFWKHHDRAAAFGESGKRLSKVESPEVYVKAKTGPGYVEQDKPGRGYEVLRDYTSKGGDRKMNGALREDRVTPNMQKDLDALDGVMKPISQEIHTYRGITDPRKVFGDAWNEKGSNEGLEWRDPGYTSTAGSAERALNHTNGGGVMMEIVSARGTKVVKGFADQRGYDGEPEDEFLLQRGMRFRIIKDIKPTKTGQKIDFNNPFNRHDRTLIIEAVPPDAPLTASATQSPTSKIQNDLGEKNQQHRDSVTAALTLAQAITECFCMETHKPGLCKGQKRGETEPGQQDATKATPAQRAQIAVKGLSTAIAQAQQVAQANTATNPKLAAMARKAVADYSKALRPHQQTLKQAAGANAKAAKTGVQDTKQQDRLDARAARQKESTEKRAQAILDRRAEAARVAKMSPKERAAYGKQKTAEAKAKRAAAEAQILKQAGRR